MHKLFILSLLLFNLTILGCKSKESTPELRDPVYLDLKKEHEDREKKLMTMEKQLASTKTILQSEESRSTSKKIKLKQYQILEGYVRKLKEETQYYKIRSDLRRVYTRKAYARAFEKEEPWPDPKEYEAYMQNKKLRSVPMEWSERTPEAGDLKKEADKATE